MVPKLNQKRKDQLLDTLPSNLNKCSNVIIEQLQQQNVTLSLRHLMNEEVLSRSWDVSRYAIKDVNDWVHPKKVMELIQKICIYYWKRFREMLAYKQMSSFGLWKF